MIEAGDNKVRAAIFVFALVSIFCLAGEATAQVTEPAPSPVLAYEGRLLESNVSNKLK